jgi:two-component system cell cycle response regulator
VTDELRARLVTSRGLGTADPFAQAARDDGKGGRILLVDDRAPALERLRQTLAPHHVVSVERDPQKAVFTAAQNDYDMVIASLDFKDADGLRLLSQVRSLERTRQLALLAIAEPHDRGRILRALDLGVNDYLMRPIDRNELLARVRTQLRRKRYSDRLRDTLQTSLELSVRDPLTGLSNRRYFDAHAATLLTEAVRQRRPLALMMLDLDRFKSINDTYGHQGGDAVLSEFAQRISSAIRGEHLVARLGGEEFAVLMQDTGIEAVERAAERIRQLVAAVPMQVPQTGRAVPVTVSIGIAELIPGETMDGLIARADAALYAAKSMGRDRVVRAADSRVDTPSAARQIA